MKNSLSRLPLEKQQELAHILEIIKEVADPEKVILFGSYAKGDYTEHSYVGRDGILYEYISDYDLLVVLKDATEKAYELDDRITNRTRTHKPAVNLEIHHIDYINEGLEIGQYFFSDIIKEGIVLFDKGNVKFSEPVNSHQPKLDKFRRDTLTGGLIGERNFLSILSMHSIEKVSTTQYFFFIKALKAYTIPCCLSSLDTNPKLTISENFANKVSNTQMNSIDCSQQTATGKKSTYLNC